MVLGLTPEAYVVYYSPYEQSNPVIASMNGALLFFSAYSQAKAAAEAFIQTYVVDNVEVPKYIWIQPVNRLWVDGEL